MNDYKHINLTPAFLHNYIGIHIYLLEKDRWVYRWRLGKYSNKTYLLTFEGWKLIKKPIVEYINYPKYYSYRDRLYNEHNELWKIGKKK